MGFDFARIAAALIEGIGPVSSSGAPVAPTQAAVERLDAHLRAMPSFNRRAIEAALWSVELSPLFLGFGPVRLSTMAREDRARCLARWEGVRSHRLHTVYKLVRGLAMFSIYSTPEVLEEIGYDLSAYLEELESR